MREKIIGQDLSGRDFSNRNIEGYYRDCDFSNCNFSYSVIDAVAVRCKFDGSNFTNTRIRRLYSPGSTFKDATFKKPVTHTIAHNLVGRWNILQNHEIIAEIIRQWVTNNVPDGVFKRKGLKYCDVIASRKDLSWAELSRMEVDDYIVMGYFAFEKFPEIYNKVLKHRPELEPEQLKAEMEVKLASIK